MLCRHPTLSSLISVSILAAACGSAHAIAAETPVPRLADVKDQELSDTTAAANIDSAFRLLRAARAAAPESKAANVVISPWSLQSAFGMAAIGSQNQTQAELAGYFGWSLNSPAMVNAFGDLGGQVKPTGKDGFALRTANRVWADRSVEFLPTYEQSLLRGFDATFGRADFADTTAVAEMINSWVSDATEKMIRQLVTPADIPTRGMVLTNAVYFKGTWVNKFYESATKPTDFTLEGGKVVKAPLMHQFSSFSYNDVDGCQIISLPYSGGASMIVVLPPLPPSPPLPSDQSDSLQTSPLAALAAKLDGPWWIKAMATMRFATVDFAMPKFSFEAQQRLGETLKKSGLPISFSDAADFSAMTGSASHQIADVIHAVKIDIDEKGTEAAAATAITMKVTSVAAPRDPPKIITMHVKRPYLLAIRHDSTGQLLFLGTINDPRNR